MNNIYFLQKNPVHRARLEKLKLRTASYQLKLLVIISITY